MADWRALQGNISNMTQALAEAQRQKEAQQMEFQNKIQFEQAKAVLEQRMAQENLRNQLEMLQQGGYLGGGVPSSNAPIDTTEDVLSGRYLQPGYERREAPVVPVTRGTSEYIYQPTFGLGAKGLDISFKPTLTPEGELRKEVKTQEEKEKAKSQRGIKESIDEFRGFIGQFERSYDELISSYPDIGATGFKGLGTRLAAQMGEKAGYFPETSAFLRELKPMANKMARTIEGGRVTDQDRKIYADSFANALLAPSQTNIRLASNVLVSAHRKGGNISPIMGILQASNNEIMKGIVGEVNANISTKSPVYKNKSQQGKYSSLWE